MFIKICANTNLADAQLAAELGADALGFVFAPSKRQVTVEQVAAITKHLPGNVAKVGVFTTTDVREITDAARESRLTAVQLHSQYDSRRVTAITEACEGRLGILQAVDVSAETTAEELRANLLLVLRDPGVMAALLDASHGGASGGTGKAFDWDLTATVVRQVQQETGGRVIIAGGLNEENVAAAIRRFGPWGVDVASGVEEFFGRKSPEKLRSFLAAAR